MLKLENADKGIAVGKNLGLRLHKIHQSFRPVLGTS